MPEVDTQLQIGFTKLMDLIEYEELPLICFDCLEKNKNPRLVKDSAGSECRLCSKPFVTYRWKLVDPPIPKKTVICRLCASKRNACQSCILDIEFHISLTLRDIALKIMIEEGGSEDDKHDVLLAIRESFFPSNGTQLKKKISDADTSSNDSNANANNENIGDINELIAQFPIAGRMRPQGCRTLCVYGIEEDFELDVIRSYLGVSISRMEIVPKGRYGFIEMSDENSIPKEIQTSVVLDGRKLVFAWGKRIYVPKNLQTQVGAIVRAYIRSLS